MKGAEKGGGGWRVKAYPDWMRQRHNDGVVLYKYAWIHVTHSVWVVYDCFMHRQTAYTDVWERVG